MTFNGVYRLPDTQTIGTIETAYLLARLKDNSIDLFRKIHDKKALSASEEYQNTLAYCFGQWAVLSTQMHQVRSDSVFQVTFDILNCIDDTLDKDPAPWILWLLKFKIESLMQYMDSELEINLRRMISIQDGMQEKKPCFAVPEILLANICYANEDRENAEKALEGILQKYQEPVAGLTGFFDGIILEFQNLAARSADERIRELLRRIRERLFPC